MRKSVAQHMTRNDGAKASSWLDIEARAKVLVSSEQKDFPVEGALVEGNPHGWRASAPGRQMIRLLFDAPVDISRIWLVMEEFEKQRTQEFVLRWAANGADSQEIVRQQWNFSSPTSTREIEDYKVNLRGCATLELEIIPDQNGGDARASVLEWHIS